MGLDEALKREKQESIITLYLSAIELGSRNPDVVRRAVELLFTTGRTNEAIQLFSRIPAATQLGGDLGQMVAQAAIAQNYQQAEEITRKAEEMARKAVAAKPGDFQERIWLVQHPPGRQAYRRGRGRAPPGRRAGRGRSRAVAHPGQLPDPDQAAPEGRASPPRCREETAPGAAGPGRVLRADGAGQRGAERRPPGEAMV